MSQKARASHKRSQDGQREPSDIIVLKLELRPTGVRRDWEKIRTTVPAECRRVQKIFAMFM